MDYVTITDHNVIDGALEIAHLPASSSARRSAGLISRGQVFTSWSTTSPRLSAWKSSARKIAYDLVTLLRRGKASTSWPIRFSP